MAAAPLPIYIILGHGNEEHVEFNERVTLPANRTLVTFSESSEVTHQSEVCKFLDLFSDPANNELLQNPIVAKTNIENSIKSGIHLYKPGMKIPNLTISPAAFWDFNIPTDGGGVGFQFVPSGVYRFPLNLDAFKNPYYKVPPKTQEYFSKRFKNNLENCRNKILFATSNEADTDLIKLIYSNSVYPTIEEINAKYPEYFHGVLGGISHDFKITIEDLMDKLGDGIYYYVICRADSHIYSSLMNEMKFYLIFGLNEYIIDEQLPAYKLDPDKPIVEGSEKTAKQLAMEILKFGTDNHYILEIRNLVLLFTKFIKYLHQLKYKVLNSDFIYLRKLLEEQFQTLGDITTNEFWDELIDKYVKVRDSLVTRRRMSTIQQEKIYNGGKSTVFNSIHQPSAPRTNLPCGQILLKPLGKRRKSKKQSKKTKKRGTKRLNR